MVHFDAHTDTADEAYNGEKFHHGTPFRRAVEEGLLDPKRVIQIGIKGSTSGGDYHQFSHDNGMRVIYIEEFFEIGGDVVEVSPPLDPTGNTALVGATMMFEILCLLAEARTSR